MEPPREPPREPSQEITKQMESSQCTSNGTLQKFCSQNTLNDIDPGDNQQTLMSIFGQEFDENSNSNLILSQ